MKKKFVLMFIPFAMMFFVMLSGCGHTHQFSTELMYDSTNHYYECSCGERKDEESHEESGYLQDGETHLKKCIDCDYIMLSEGYTYDQQVVHEDYLVSLATQNTKAVYKKSCVCGKAGTSTFEVEKTVPSVSVQNKVYDGQALSVANISSCSLGEVSVSWYKGDTLLTEAPKDAGEYKAVVSVAETVSHSEVTVERTISIAPRSINGIHNNVSLWEKTYDGKDYKILQVGQDQGMVEGEVLYFVIKYEGADYGSEVEEYYFSNSNNIDTQSVNANYRLSSTPTTILNSNELIRPVMFNIPVTLTKTYDGTDLFELSFDSTQGAPEGKTVKFVFSIEYGFGDTIKNAGTYIYDNEKAPYIRVDDYSWFIIDVENGTEDEVEAYNFDFIEGNWENMSITINKKALTLASSFEAYKNNAGQTQFAHDFTESEGCVEADLGERVLFTINGHPSAPVGTVIDNVEIINVSFSSTNYTLENYDGEYTITIVE